jgi:hypothetical protein
LTFLKQLMREHNVIYLRTKAKHDDRKRRN